MASRLGQGGRDAGCKRVSAGGDHSHDSDQAARSPAGAPQAKRPRPTPVCASGPAGPRTIDPALGPAAAAGTPAGVTPSVAVGATLATTAGGSAAPVPAQAAIALALPEGQEPNIGQPSSGTGGCGAGSPAAGSLPCWPQIGAVDLSRGDSAVLGVAVVPAGTPAADPWDHLAAAAAAAREHQRATAAAHARELAALLDRARAAEAAQAAAEAAQIALLERLQVTEAAKAAAEAEAAMLRQRLSLTDGVVRAIGQQLDDLRRQLCGAQMPPPPQQQQQPRYAAAVAQAGGDTAGAADAGPSAAGPAANVAAALPAPAAGELADRDVNCAPHAAAAEHCNTAGPPAGAADSSARAQDAAVGGFGAMGEGSAGVDGPGGRSPGGHTGGAGGAAAASSDPASRGANALGAASGAAGGELQCPQAILLPRPARQQQSLPASQGMQPPQPPQPLHQQASQAEPGALPPAATAPLHPPAPAPPAPQGQPQPQTLPPPAGPEPQPQPQPHLGPANLRELQAFLDANAPPTGTPAGALSIDLRSATLRGPVPPDGLLRVPSGLALRDGGLEGCCVLVADGAQVAFDQVRFLGAPGQLPGKDHGVLECKYLDQAVVTVSGAGTHALLARCSVAADRALWRQRKTKNYQTECVCVRHGGRAELADCELLGAPGCGLLSMHQGSAAVAVRTAARHNALAGFAAVASGAVEAKVCAAERNGAPVPEAPSHDGNGASSSGGSDAISGDASGGGSSAEADVATYRGHGFYAVGGGKLEVGPGCRTNGNTECGYMAEGKKSVLNVDDGCKADSNGVHGFAAHKGGALSAGLRCEARRNGASGFCGRGRGSVLSASNGCLAAGNAGSGFLATDAASLTADRYCEAQSNLQSGFHAERNSDMELGPRCKSEGNSKNGFTVEGGTSCMRLGEQCKALANTEDGFAALAAGRMELTGGCQSMVNQRHGFAASNGGQLDASAGQCLAKSNKGDGFCCRDAKSSLNAGPGCAAMGNEGSAFVARNGGDMVIGRGVHACYHEGPSLLACGRGAVVTIPAEWFSRLTTGGDWKVEDGGLIKEAV